MKYKIEPARQSKKSELEPKFIFADPLLIGTSEQPQQKNYTEVLESILKTGYKGPAVSLIETAGDNLYNQTAQKKPLKIDVKFGQFGVADGHHRLAALRLLRSLNLLKYQYMVFQIIPVHNPEVVVAKNLVRPNHSIDIDYIKAQFAHRNRVADTSKVASFFVYLNNGQLVRLYMGQPNILIERCAFKRPGINDISKPY